VEYRLEILKEESYLHVRVSGARTRKTIASIATEILDACRRNQVDQVLVDASELSGRLSIFDSFQLVAVQFPKLRRRHVISRAVIVDAEERSERLRFFERIARKRGYDISVFFNVDVAVEYLRSTRPQTA
jgi:hypothetical protein